MNWKIKLILFLTKLRSPIHLTTATNINKLRKTVERAARLGTFLFDEKIAIKQVENTHANNIPLRIYKNSERKNQPVIVFYHGGGFVLYNLDSHDNVCRRLCRDSHAMVISVDYRLAPEHTFPAAHEDAFEALQWVKNNIETYGGNPEDIIVAGDSAGGNLAACMAHKCRKENIPLKAQILIYPWIDGKMNNPSINRNGKGFMLEKEGLIWFQNVYGPRKEDHLKPEISPCYEKEFNGLPPAFIITAQYDPLLDDGFKYYKQLTTANVNVKYKEYSGLFHGFFNLPLIDENVMHCYKDIVDFIARVR